VFGVSLIPSEMNALRRPAWLSRPTGLRVAPRLFVSAAQLEVFGVELVGIHAETGRKLLLSVVFFLLVLVAVLELRMIL
jgi:hypothetical protein